MDLATAQKALLVSFPRTWNSLYIVGTSLGLKCYNSKYITDYSLMTSEPTRGWVAHQVLEHTLKCK